MALTKEAKALLRKVRKHILEEPRRFNMSDWISRRYHTSDKHYDGFAGKVKASSYAKCGTAACIAGWTVLIHDGMQSSAISVSGRASQLLGITYTDDLFGVTGWDDPYASQYQKARSVKEKAEIAGRYINHYIKTRG